MNKKIILGVADENSVSGKRRIENDALAESSKEKMEIEGLYAAYEKAVEDRFGAERALADILPIISKDKLMPDDLHSIRAMRDVALAAIDLAKSFSIKTDKK